MEKIKELLMSITEDTSIEEARRIVADVVDLIQPVVDDITGYNGTIQTLTDDNTRLNAEVARLQEENGRLFRERIVSHQEEAREHVYELEKSVDEQIAELQDSIEL